MVEVGGYGIKAFQRNNDLCILLLTWAEFHFVFQILHLCKYSVSNIVAQWSTAMSEMLYLNTSGLLFWTCSEMLYLNTSRITIRGCTDLFSFQTMVVDLATCLCQPEEANFSMVRIVSVKSVLHQPIRSMLHQHNKSV